MTLGAPTADALIAARCGPHVLLAISDGAGDSRATRSSEAAHRAVSVAAAEASRSWPVYGADTQLLTEALAAARIDLLGWASRDRVDPAVFATTLMLVLLAGPRILAARIGDGSLYTWDGAELSRFCSAALPEIGTPMLVQPDWRDWVTTADMERDFVTGLVMCSDGADDFFLEIDPSRDARVPSASMIKGLADYHDQWGAAAGVSYVMQMLNDPDWTRRTVDDRSVILAIKPPSHRTAGIAPSKANAHARTAG